MSQNSYRKKLQTQSASLSAQKLATFERFKQKLHEEIVDSPFPSCHVDPDGVILISNQMFADIFIYSVEELGDSHINMLVPTQVRKKHDTMVYEFFRNHNDYTVNLNVQGLNSKDKPMNLMNSLVLKKHELFGLTYEFVLCTMQYANEELLFKMNRIFDMNSNSVYFWKFVLCIVSFATFIMLPKGYAIDSHIEPSIIWSYKVVYMLDILVKLNTSRLVDDEVVYTRLEIWLDYLKNEFTIDLICALPFSYFHPYNKNTHLVYDLISLSKVYVVFETYNNITNTKLNRKTKNFLNLLNYYYTGYFKIFTYIIVAFLLVNFYTSLFIIIYRNTENQYYSWFNYTDKFNNLFHVNRTVVDPFKTSMGWSEGDAIFPILNFIFEWDSYHVMRQLFDVVFYEVSAVFLLYNRMLTYNNNERFIVFMVGLSGILYISWVISSIIHSIGFLDDRNRDYYIKKSIIEKACSENQISDDLMNNLYTQLDENHVDFETVKIERFQSILKTNVYNTIHKVRYSQILTCKLFSNFPKETMESLLKFLKFTNQKNVYRKSEQFDSMFYINSGTFKTYTDQMALVNEFFEREIVGFEYFVNWMKEKRVLNDKLNEDSNGLNSQMNKSRMSNMHSFNDNRSEISGASKRSARKMRFNIIKYNEYCYAFESEYVIINAIGMYKLIQQDQKIYDLISNYFKKQSIKVNSDDEVFTFKVISEFKEKAFPAVMTLRAGYIIAMNDLFQTCLSEIKIGDHLKKFLDRPDSAPLDSTSDLSNGEINLKYKEAIYKCDLNIEVQNLVITKYRTKNTRNIDYKCLDENYILSFKSDTSLFKDNRLKMVTKVGETHMHLDLWDQGQQKPEEKQTIEVIPVVEEVKEPKKKKKNKKEDDKEHNKDKKDDKKEKEKDKDKEKEDKPHKDKKDKRDIEKDSKVVNNKDSEHKKEFKKKEKKSKDRNQNHDAHDDKSKKILDDQTESVHSLFSGTIHKKKLDSKE